LSERVSLYTATYYLQEDLGATPRRRYIRGHVHQLFFVDERSLLQLQPSSANPTRRLSSVHEVLEVAYGSVMMVSATSSTLSRGERSDIKPISRTGGIRSVIRDDYPCFFLQTGFHLSKCTLSSKKLTTREKVRRGK
jgi:hypothetical protein